MRSNNRPHPGWSQTVLGIWPETSQTKGRVKRTNRYDAGNWDLLLESTRNDVRSNRPNRARKRWTFSHVSNCLIRLATEAACERHCPSTSHFSSSAKQCCVNHGLNAVTEPSASRQEHSPFDIFDARLGWVGSGPRRRKGYPTLLDKFDPCVCSVCSDRVASCLRSATVDR